VVTPLNVLSLFSGIGGLELGLERAGMTIIGQIEIDSYCRQVLAKHWPDVPRHDDVRTATEWWTSEPRPRVDVVAGGFPCQPVSSAGLRRAQEDPRWLWPAMAQVIDATRPTWVIGENVPGLLKLGLPVILDFLDWIGYRYRVGTISACALGAPHPRSRVFVVAHSAAHRCDSWGVEFGNGGEREPARAQSSERRGAGAGGPGWWETEPDVARVAYGVPNGVDRIGALGNAVVPQVAEYVGRLIVAHAEQVAA
jgi:DNA (cytosine-5)-methyltransferase 1